MVEKKCFQEISRMREVIAKAYNMSGIIFTALDVLIQFQNKFKIYYRW